MLPKWDLTTFFFSVYKQGMQSMDPSSVDLDMARHNIELLELMSEKTKGNRTPEEDQLVEHLLFQLRMAFVQSSKEKNG
ncbi:MAG: DUF1844 domain-containing protein [Proteobacteria bacterium]|nr:DUF1844 domain-containing protein [Pseudomonadota bacterium]